MPKLVLALCLLALTVTAVASVPAANPQPDAMIFAYVNGTLALIPHTMTFVSAYSCATPVHQGVEQIFTHQHGWRTMHNYFCSYAGYTVTSGNWQSWLGTTRWQLKGRSCMCEGWALECLASGKVRAYCQI